MELSLFVNSMRDPSGLPFYPLVFQALLVLTFAMHITMINLAIGCAFTAVCEAGKKTAYGLRLARGLGRTLTVTFSIAIVLGVAPLLFVQVIYDPMWYSANLMSAFWAMLFLVIVTVAFYSAYGFYLGNSRATVGDSRLLWGMVAAVMLLFAGVIMHMLSMEQLNVYEWKNWVLDATGMPDTGGGAFHGVKTGRFLHFVLSSFAVTGVYLMLYAWYFQNRSDYEPGYLAYVAGKGANMAMAGTVLSIAAGFWWAGTVPGEFHFMRNAFFLPGAIGGIALLAYLGKVFFNPLKHAPHAAIAMFLVIFVMCCAREALRMDYVAQAGYSVYDYKLNLDWGSTLLFFASFVMGLCVLCFPAMVAFRAGRAERDEVVTLDPAIGKRAVAMLIAWFVVVAGLGLVISLKNGTLL
jgi:hypothetical protein